MAELTRRTASATAAGAVVMAAGSERLAWDFSFPAIEGGSVDLAAFKGRVPLVASTASFCYTYQYEGLQKLHTERSLAGLTVIGAPSRDFHQELADDATVRTFCETRFAIDFPPTPISHVTGLSEAPFHA